MATDSMTTDSVATVLTLFRNLILEMRLEIWKSYSEGNRLITIDDKIGPKDRCVVVDDDAAATITRVCLPQILLRVCHEARNVALETLGARVTSEREKPLSSLEEEERHREELRARGKVSWAYYSSKADVQPEGGPTLSECHFSDSIQLREDWKNRGFESSGSL
jgi:hypothetical protein